MKTFFTNKSTLRSASAVLVALMLIACLPQRNEDKAHSNNIQGPTMAMEDIVADPNMDFVSHASATFQLALLEPPAERAFLSLYTQYQMQGGEWRINYDSRLLAIPLEQYYSVQLAIPQHHSRILMQLWTYEEGQPPVTKELDIKEVITISEF